MNPDRMQEITEMIVDQARADNAPVAIKHVCTACASAIDAVGAGVYLAGDLGVIEPVHATKPIGARLVELQAILGHGPATQAATEQHAVLADNLASRNSRRHWPMLAPAAMANGVRSIFAFPIAMSGVSVGALEVYRATPGVLSEAELDDAWLFADAAMKLIESCVVDVPTAAEFELFASDFAERWAEVHQAVGVVAAQLDVDAATAFLCLRERAFITGCPLSLLAADVLAGQVRFDNRGS